MCMAFVSSFVRLQNIATKSLDWNSNGVYRELFDLPKADSNRRVHNELTRFYHIAFNFSIHKRHDTIFNISIFFHPRSVCFVRCVCIWYGVYPMIESRSFCCLFGFSSNSGKMQIFKCFPMQFLMRLPIFNNIYLFNVTCSCANICVSKSFSNKWELFEIGRPLPSIPRVTKSLAPPM